MIAVEERSPLSKREQITIRVIDLFQAHDGSFSRKVVYIFLPLFFGQLCFYEKKLIGGDWLTWVHIFLMSLGWIIPIFVISKSLYSKLSNGNKKNFLMLASYLCFEILSSSTIEYFSAKFIELNNPNYIVRVIEFMPFTISLLLICNYLVRVYLSHQSNLDELARQRLYLNAISKFHEETIKNYEFNIKNEIQTALNSPIKHLEESLQVNSNNQQIVMDEIFELLEKHVKPLSRSLDEFENVQEIFSNQLTNEFKAKIRIPQKLDLGNLYHPALWTFLISSINFGGTLRDFSIGQLVQNTFTTFGAMYGLIYVLRKILSGVELKRFYTFLVSIITFEILGPGLLFLVRFSEVAVPREVTSMAFLVFAAIGIFAFILNAFFTTNKKTESEIQIALENTAKHNEKLKNKIWTVRNRLSHVLHGSVQGALYAAAIKISSTEKLDEELVSKIKQDINLALSQLEIEKDQNESIRLRLNDLSDVWYGVCTIFVNLNLNTETLLENNLELSDVAFELISESVTNAVKHGSATVINVDFRIKDENSMTIRVMNNGKEFSDFLNQGKGFHFFDNVTSNWTIENGKMLHSIQFQLQL